MFNTPKNKKTAEWASAVHRAVSSRKRDSLPVNRLKPKIKVVIAAEHLCCAEIENLIDSFLELHDSKSDRLRQEPHNTKKAIDSLQLWEWRLVAGW